MHACYACMLCMYVLHVCYACMLYVYGMRVWYACMLCMYGMHPHRPNPMKTCHFPGIHSGLACQRCPQSDPSGAQSRNEFQQNSGNSLSFRKEARIERFQTCKRVHHPFMCPSPKPFKINKLRKTSADIRCYESDDRLFLFFCYRVCRYVSTFAAA